MNAQILVDGLIAGSMIGLGAIDEGLSAVADHPDIGFAGYLQDAQKEYAEARLTEVIVKGESVVPTPDALAGDAHGFALGRVDDGDAVLSAMEDLYAVLVTMDYPDAITGNLRRSTDVARSLIEKTRGELAVARVSQDLHDALDRHRREVLEKED